MTEERPMMTPSLEERVGALGGIVKARRLDAAWQAAKDELQRLGAPFEVARWKEILASGQCLHGTAAWAPDFCDDPDCGACRLESHDYYHDCDCARCGMVVFVRAGYILGRVPGLYTDEASLRFSEEQQRRIDAREKDGKL
jgi:hypothetical protein